jgi:hypothetical protein
MKAIYRVECNNGSKYFDNSLEAIAFYNLKREQPMSVVQLWKFISLTTQELVSPIPNAKQK